MGRKRKRKREFQDKRLFSRPDSSYIWAKLPDEHRQIRPVSTKCKDEKAASLFCDEWERRAADPAYRRAAEATLSGAISEYLAEMHRRGARAGTVDFDTRKAGHLIRMWGEDWPLLRINNDLVLKYIDDRLAEPGATKGSTVKPLTVKHELGVLKRVLEWARFRGKFPYDLATIIPPRFSGKHKPRTRAPTREELVKLLRELDNHRAAHIAFIVATGARRAESFRAQREDVDLQNLVVQMRGTKTVRAADRVPITGITHPFVIFALQHAPGKVGEPLFAPWGKLNRDVAAACVRADIDRVSPNDLRRAFGKWHRLAGASAEQVSLLLRHTTDTLAQTTYAQISAADIGEQLRTTVPISYSPTALLAPGEPNRPPSDQGK